MGRKGKVPIIEDVVKIIRLCLGIIHCFGAFHATEILMVEVYNSKSMMKRKQKLLEKLPHQDKKPQNEDFNKEGNKKVLFKYFKYILTEFIIILSES